MWWRRVDSNHRSRSNRFTVCPLWPLGNSSKKISKQAFTCLENGAGGRTRTPDLLITNQLLYQLSYTSLNWFLLSFQATITFYHRKFNLSIGFFIIYKSFTFSVFLSNFSTKRRMVGATGLEPAASWSQTKHSTKLSYAPNSALSLYRTAALFVKGQKQPNRQTF